MTTPLSALDVFHGSDLYSGEVGESRRFLSVVEIQQVLRDLQARRSRAVAVGVGTPSRQRDDGDSQRPALNRERVPTAGRSRGARKSSSVQGWGDIAPQGPARGDSDELAAGWIAVLAAHPGAGASTVALAIGDAAAVDDRRVHLVDTADPSRSGLLAATSEELGTDVTGAWRRGLRPGVTIDRPATDVAPVDWPVPPNGDGPALTVVDLGLASSGDLAWLTADRARPVVVCRPTVPGVRLTEQVLDRLARRPVAIASVGPNRWSGEVTASLGPRLRALRAAGRVVPVPTDRRLQITGPTSSPLPKSVRSAGHGLLELLDGSHPRAL